jgi:hypothetical protein
VCFDYFYEEDLDEDVLCRALSNIITSLPFLGGRIKGILPVSKSSMQIQVGTGRLSPAPP